MKYFIIGVLLLCVVSCHQVQPPTDPQADMRAIIGAVVSNPQLWAFVQPHAKQHGFVSITFSNPVVYAHRFRAVYDFELPGHYPIRYAKVSLSKSLLSVEAFSIDDNQAAILVRMPVRGIVAIFYLTKKETWSIWHDEVYET